MQLSRWLCLLGVLAALHACHKPSQREFLDTIPARCPFVAQVDIDATLKMADCESHGGALKLTPTLQQFFAITDSALLPAAGDIAAMGRWIDLTQAYFFRCEASPAVILTAPLRLDRIASMPVGKKLESELLGDVQLLQVGNTELLRDDAQAWVAVSHVDDLAACVDSIITLADSKSIASDDLLIDFLGGASAVRAWIPVSVPYNPWGEAFDAVLLSVDFTDRAVALSAQCAQGNRLVAPLKRLTSVDPYAMGRFPFPPTFAAAIGLESGTVALAVAPGGNAETIMQLEPSNWLIKYLSPQQSESAWTMRLLGTLDRESLHAVSDSCYLALTNFDPDDFDEGYDESPQAKGEKIITWATIPYRSEVMKAFKLNQGYLLNAFATDSIAEAYLRSLGPSTYLLPTLINDYNRCATSIFNQ